MTQLNGKVALVTGASRGIGRAIAERYGRLGASVVVNYASSAKGAQECVAAIERAGGNAIAVKANVSSVVEIHRLFDKARQAFERIDIVVANAGIEIVGISSLEFTEEQFDQAFAVNTKGAFFTLQQAARTVEDGGRILYVGSSTTAFPMPGHALYGGSKMAPQFLVEVMAKEFGARGVTVNSILPTAIEGAGVSTDEVRPAVREFIERYNPMKRMGTVEDVADAAEYLASPLAKFVSGQHLLLSGGGPA
jgi:3-oxoacyl-[acyl-carrier protein] reductase